MQMHMQSASLDLGRIGPGFADPVGDSQMTFRRCLDALASPGKLFTVEANAAITASLMPGAGALALALLDQDTSVWLSRSLATAGAYLRFHTGCRIAATPGLADFALIGAPQELQGLHHFCKGDAEFPERSATLIVQTSRLDVVHGWHLTGPGIAAIAALGVAGFDGLLADRFVREWEINHAQFPCGIDMVFVSGNQICGLPRTTRIVR